jgi:hypothetical protein
MLDEVVPLRSDIDNRLTGPTLRQVCEPFGAAAPALPGARSSDLPIGDNPGVSDPTSRRKHRTTHSIQEEVTSAAPSPSDTRSGVSPTDNWAPSARPQTAERRTRAPTPALEADTPANPAPPTGEQWAPTIPPSGHTVVRRPVRQMPPPRPPPPPFSGA